MRRNDSANYKISTIFILIVFAIIQNNIYAQNLEDIQGWNKAKWGMTEEEILSAFPGQITKHELEKTPIYCSTLQINNIKIVDKDFEVVFLMDCDTNRLKSITIRPKQKWGTVENMIAFDSLKEELIKKYGEPTLSDSNNRIASSAKLTWVFPSTEITLQFFSIEDNSFMGLNYKQRENQVLFGNPT